MTNSGLKAAISGTLSELEILWPWNILSEILGLDFYKRCVMSEDQIHTVTEVELLRYFTS